MAVTLRREAERDLEGAAKWYEDQSRGLGHRFLDEVLRTLDAIQGHPRLYPQVHEMVHRAVTHRFPFGVFYLVDGEDIVVVAVMHASRDPALSPDRV